MSDFPMGVRSMGADTYHADPVPGGSLSQSGVKLLLPPSCPAIFEHRRRHPPRPTEAFSFGHAAHAEVLGVGRTMVEIPTELLSSDGGVRSKEAKAWVAQQEQEGRTPLKPDDAAVVRAMAEKIREHPVASRLFSRGTPEQAMFWRDERTGIIRRGMLDWLPDPGKGRLILADYKTAVSADPEEFGRTWWKYGYHRQARWYLDGAAACGLADDAAFVFVVQDKNPPYVVSVFQPDLASLRVGDIQNRRGIDIYRQCMETGRWPGYSDDVETVRLPYYIESRYETELIA